MSPGIFSFSSLYQKEKKMQLWKWVLLFGLLFAIMYDPSTRTMTKFFDDPRVERGNVFPTNTPSREAQGDRGPSDDDE